MSASGVLPKSLALSTCRSCALWRAARQTAGQNSPRVGTAAVAERRVLHRSKRGLAEAVVGLVAFVWFQRWVHLQEKARA